MPPKPRTAAELMAIIDANYEDIVEGAGIKFSGAGSNILNNAFIEQLQDKPVLQHILKLHLQKGASFVTGQNFAALFKLSKDVTMEDQISGAIIGSALKAGNFTGDLMKATSYIDWSAPSR